MIGGMIRDSGIEVIGELPWGSHFCMFYWSAEELADVLVPYFNAGLKDGESCIYIASGPLDAEVLKDAIRKRIGSFDAYVEKSQLKVISHEECYLKDGALALDDVIGLWVSMLQGVLEKGYGGLRVAGNASWLDENERGDFLKYERDMNGIINEAGDVTHFIEHVRDIAERKLSEEALRKSEEKFRLVADFTYDWEIWAGPGDELYYISPSCERITGYRAEEFYKDPTLLSSIIVPEDRPAYIDHMRSYLAADASVTIFRILPRDGEIRWIEHQCQPVFGDKGVYLGRRISNRDITKRKRAEMEVESAKAQAELYLDLMSHDINNMSQVGIGFLELALDTLDLDDNGRSIISRALGAQESSTKLIDNVRKLQKVRSGELSSQEIDLGQSLSVQSL